MQINATNSILGSSTDTGTSTVLPSKTLSQHDFLNLLVTQITSQDPLKPMDNQDMLTQMVQFNTLQNNTSMQAELAKLQDSQSFLQANALLGRAVSLQVDSDTTAQGVVSGVEVDAGTPKIVVGGVAYDLSQVLTVAPAVINQ
jgi:flagellar basal-body rod modification protein FlgD